MRKYRRARRDQPKPRQHRWWPKPTEEHPNLEGCNRGCEVYRRRLDVPNKRPIYTYTRNSLPLSVGKGRGGYELQPPCEVYVPETESES